MFHPVAPIHSPMAGQRMHLAAPCLPSRSNFLAKSINPVVTPAFTAILLIGLCMSGFNSTTSRCASAHSVEMMSEAAAVISKISSVF